MRNLYNTLLFVVYAIFMSSEMSASSGVTLNYNQTYSSFETLKIAFEFIQNLNDDCRGTKFKVTLKKNSTGFYDEATGVIKVICNVELLGDQAFGSEKNYINLKDVSFALTSESANLTITNISFRIEQTFQKYPSFYLTLGSCLLIEVKMNFIISANS